jgi:hypothetical protein
MLKFQHRLAFFTVPAVLALSAVSYGSVVAFASPSPSPTVNASHAASVAAESTTASETVEPNEPALPGGGYADTANVQADTQQEGIN